MTSGRRWEKGRWREEGRDIEKEGGTETKGQRCRERLWMGDIGMLKPRLVRIRSKWL